MDPELGDALRAEARGMADAYVEALLHHATPGTISGVYFKGSANKPWDSVLDYVPEFGDVDIHVRFTDWPGEAHGLGTVRRSALVAERAMAAFRTRFPAARHRPRPQVMVVNELEDRA